MNMIAAEKKRRAEEIAATLRATADQRSAALSTWRHDGVEAHKIVTRDVQADALAELAELVAGLDFRQMA